MFSKLLLFGTLCFVLGILASRIRGAIINKFYVEHFYVPRVVIRPTRIGDAEAQSVAIFKNKDIAKCELYLYNNRYLKLKIDAMSINVDLSKTRLYLHDSIAILPLKTGYDLTTSTFWARYCLPRPAIEGKSISVWFFN